MPHSAIRPVVAVLDGPDIVNMSGVGEPEWYGRAKPGEVEAFCAEASEDASLAIDRRSNGEAELVTGVQACRGRDSGIVLKPGGFTTTPAALPEAFPAAEPPVIEVQITDSHRREPFFRVSCVSPAAIGVIRGLGVRGYAIAVQAMADILEEHR